MNIILKEATTSEIKKLENESAFTWEGLCNDEETLEQIKNSTISYGVVDKNKETLLLYTWSGKIMNELYSLKGNKRYSDGLTFVSIGLEEFCDIGKLSTYKFIVGARWLDDIVDNNARK